MVVSQSVHPLGLSSAAFFRVQWGIFSSKQHFLGWKHLVDARGDSLFCLIWLNGNNNQNMQKIISERQRLENLKGRAAAADVHTGYRSYCSIQCNWFFSLTTNSPTFMFLSWWHHRLQPKACLTGMFAAWCLTEGWWMVMNRGTSFPVRWRWQESMIRNDFEGFFFIRPFSCPISFLTFALKFAVYLF